MGAKPPSLLRIDGKNCLDCSIVPEIRLFPSVSVKKTIKQGAACFFLFSACPACISGKGRISREIIDAAATAFIRIRSTIDDSAKTAHDHGSRAHGAWLQGDIQRAVFQAPVAFPLGAVAETKDLGMSCRVIQLFPAVMVSPEDFVIAHEHCADGDFPFGKGFFGLQESQSHS